MNVFLFILNLIYTVEFQDLPKIDQPIPAPKSDYNWTNQFVEYQSYFLESASVVINFSSFQHMSCMQLGGAIYLASTRFISSMSTWTNCSSKSGGAIFATTSTIHFYDAHFDFCRAFIQGGVCAFYSNTIISMFYCRFRSNHADELCGAVLIDEADDVLFFTHDFSHNSAGEVSGSIGIFDVKSVIIYNTTISSCVSGRHQTDIDSGDFYPNSKMMKKSSDNLKLNEMKTNENNTNDLYSNNLKSHIKDWNLKSQQQNNKKSIFTDVKSFRKKTFSGAAAGLIVNTNYVMIEKCQFTKNTVIRDSEKSPNNQGIDFYFSRVGLIEMSNSTLSIPLENSFYFDQVQHKIILKTVIDGNKSFPTWAATETFSQIPIKTVGNDDDDEIINNVEPTLPPGYKTIHLPPQRTRQPAPTIDLADPNFNIEVPTRLSLPWASPTKSPARSIIPTKSPSPSLKKGFSFSISLSFSQIKTYSFTLVLEEITVVSYSFGFYTTISLQPSYFPVISYFYAKDENESQESTEEEEKEIRVISTNEYETISYTRSLRELVFITQSYTRIMIESHRQLYIPIEVFSNSPIGVFVQVVDEVQRRKFTNSSIIGITCGSALVLFLIAGAVSYVVRRRKEDELSSSEISESNWYIINPETNNHSLTRTITDRSNTKTDDKITYNYYPEDHDIWM
ncbi:hypothetical protein TRFO_39497 [Tritrichomonas foetus]|uniref:Right handed beta helix domain-containing protein n=1 Tax=Tritrichomonas foetus TaxID=1144522 RepID=A0A1J4J4L6_9EUKA|nr:hypothetical protein TRFO_39497 [Tritrichomonas foetus]|eukprot:OHS94290.1 hypothetical protein TRFO_39497 [Tritrichomonas foetus]